MKTANTKTAATKAAVATTATAVAKKPVPVDAGSPDWRFTPDEVSLMGHKFAARYSVAKSGDVYVFAKLGDTPIRLHVGKAEQVYHAAFEAAMAARAAKQPEAEAEAKAAEPAKQATPAKAAKQPKAEAKAAEPAKQATPAKAAKQPKAEAKAAEPAKQVDAAAKGWIGTEIAGNGWRIAFDQATQRTRVSFDAQPSAKQKAAVEAAGFYFSAQLNSWNKKLTCKAYRAAQALAATLAALK